MASDDEIALAKSTESAQVRGLGVFMLSLVGLERGAVQKHFAEFISDSKTTDQIEFVGLVIEHLTRNGVIDPGLLYDSPFSVEASGRDVEVLWNASDFSVTSKW